MFRLELKKILKTKNGLISLAIFLFLVVIMGFVRPKLESEISYLEKANFEKGNYDFVDKRDGSILEKENFERKIEELKAMANIEGNNNDTKEIKTSAQNKLDKVKTNGYENIDFWKVYNYRAAHPLAIIAIIAIIATLICNIYSDEVVASMDTLILSSKNKYRALNAKGIIAIILPALIYITYLGITFIETVLKYGKPANGELQAFRIVENFIFMSNSYTILEYTLLKIGFVFLIIISLSVVAAVISFKTDSSMASITIFGVYMISGKIIAMLIKPIMKFLSKLGLDWLIITLNFGNYPDLILQGNELIGMSIGKVNVLGESIQIFTMINIILLVLTIIFTTYMFYSFRKIESKK